ncbi:MAG: glycosyl transferase family 2 [Nitrosomonadales bacterium]|nr:MAG: glycosyl transferase family 2 [Nitrosomonadales bacterium]
MTIAIVIPSYKVREHIANVIAAIPPYCHLIYVVDDCCPQQTGEFVTANVRDPRVRVVCNERNRGVGGAVMAGYQAAISDGAKVIVKIDGDGQMEPSLVSRFIEPILQGQADYTKGNRFYDLTNIGRMPPLRLLGNAVLSFMAKFSTGYWDVFDPTNGYTAIHADVARHLPLSKISQRYFFETDMLFRLNTLRAVVVDVPMDAVYGDEKSNLKIRKIALEFLGKHVRNFHKRIFYNYFLRDFSAASLELLGGLALLVFGMTYGVGSWVEAARADVTTPPGTVMLAALPVLLGVQLLLGFLSHDMQSVPRLPVHPLLPPATKSTPLQSPC